MKEKIIVITSGYFNPLHGGHIRLFSEAKKLGNHLLVIVNNDLQVKLKRSKKFMDIGERSDIIGALEDVDFIEQSDDKDRTVINTLKRIVRYFRPKGFNFIFAKGGDSNKKNTPEYKLCKELGIKVVFNVGGKKIQSSSWLKK